LCTNFSFPEAEDDEGDDSTAEKTNHRGAVPGVRLVAAKLQREEEHYQCGCEEGEAGQVELGEYAEEEGDVVRCFFDVFGDGYESGDDGSDEAYR